MNREKLHLLLAIILLALPFVYTHAEETTDYDYVLVTDVSQLQAGQEYALLSAEEGNPRYISQFSNEYLECSGVRINNLNSNVFNSSQRSANNKPLHHIGIEPLGNGHFHIRNEGPNGQKLFWTSQGGSLYPDIDTSNELASWDISIDSETHKANIVNVQLPENHWVFVSKNSTYIINNSTKAQNLTDIGIRLYRKIDPNNPLQGEEKTASPIPTPAAGTNPTSLYAPAAITFPTASGRVSYSSDDGNTWTDVHADGISLYDTANKQPNTVHLQLKAVEEGKTESDVVEGWYTFKYRSATIFEYTQASLNVKENEVVSNQLSIVYDNPDNDTPPSITYTSSNPSVATVTTDGKVTVIAPGSTTITASFEGDEKWKGATASYDLTITPLEPADKPTVDITGGNSQETAVPIYSPSKIAVMAPGEGSVLYRDVTTYADAQWQDITGELSFYKEDKSANTVHLQFKAVADNHMDSDIVGGWYTFKYHSATTFEFERESLSLEKGNAGSNTLQTEYDKPADEGTPAITYSSSDETVATVNPQGIVTAVKPGIAVITATIAEDEQWKGAEATFTVTVTVPAVPKPKVEPAGGDSENCATVIYAPEKIKVTVSAGTVYYNAPNKDNNTYEVPNDGIFISQDGKASFTSEIICFTWNNGEQINKVSGWYTFKF